MWNIAAWAVSYDVYLGTTQANMTLVGNVPAQMTLNPPTENSKGLRLGSFVQIRNVIEEEIESALQGKKSAKDALDSAVTRGNDLLRQFQRANM